MSLPRTLLDMAGVPNRPHPLADSAVVMIDAQLEYVTGAVPLPGVDAALKEGAAILAKARELGRPIIHIAHLGAAGGLFDPDGPNFAFAPAVAPARGEDVITKKLPDAFANTNLEERLKILGVSSIIVAGFMTHMCVSSTVRAASTRGFGCTIVAGACATRDLPDGKGGVMASRDLHNAEIAALSDRFAMIVQSAGDLA